MPQHGPRCPEPRGASRDIGGRRLLKGAAPTRRSRGRSASRHPSPSLSLPDDPGLLHSDRSVPAARARPWRDGDGCIAVMLAALLSSKSVHLHGERGAAMMGRFRRGWARPPMARPASSVRALEGRSLAVERVGTTRLNRPGERRWRSPRTEAALAGLGRNVAKLRIRSPSHP